ncbi:MAG: hypothetical protein QMC70_06725 [Bacteroidia bacterium]|jgi:PBP1b-binding outer membrane lipoprotein LpoB|tara:strand:+ start:24 stop:401 length:378 start_codon:yes stop_codon:yes gene_type:complete
MRKTKIIFIALITLILGGCSGSDTYRGNWKATNEEGTQLDIVFGEKDFSITENGKIENFEYSQNSVSIENSVETYGIKLDDGRAFQIHFPIGNDESKGAILDANDRPLYIISRNAYIEYKDVYGL